MFDLSPPATGGSPAAWPKSIRFAWLAVTMVLAACGAKDSAPPATGARTMPPPEVGVVAVAPQVVALQTELPGRVSPICIAQVRARVNGIVQKRLFVEGSEVKTGRLLYQIDLTVDAATGQITLRAEVPNADGQGV